MRRAWWVAALLLAAACAPAVASIEPAASPSVDLATPSSFEPAAGICGGAEGRIVSIALRPDVPDPRCAVVRSDQVLEIVNATDTSRRITLGRFQAEIAAGGRLVLEEEFGRYLAPGVHRVQAEPCCGPELWLKPG